MDLSCLSRFAPHFTDFLEFVQYHYQPVAVRMHILHQRKDILEAHHTISPGWNDMSVDPVTGLSETDGNTRK